MKRVVAGVTGALLTLVATSVAAPSAQAADFCASKISGSTYYQKNFSYGGNVVATICAPIHSTAGNAYLYSRGAYYGVTKYMKLTIQTYNSGTVSVDGNYAYYVYRNRPAGLHDYHAVMFDGNGTKIVDGWGSDYE